MIEEFESVFNIEFSNNDVEEILTLGDAQELICSKLPNSSGKQVKCLTAMAYYRMARSFGAGKRVTPSCQVAKPAGMSPKDFQKRLETQSNLRLDFLTRPSFLVVASMVARLVTWVLAPIFLDGLIAFVVGVVIFLINHLASKILARRDDCVWVFEGSIAELSRKASEVNFGKLVSCGGRWNRNGVWETMTSIVQVHTGLSSDRMVPGTKFI